jgi:hypothetical protein
MFGSMVDMIEFGRIDFDIIELLLFWLIDIIEFNIIDLCFDIIIYN